ncbi:hypothetical protein ACFX2G_040872 [Malus domestica]
MAFSFVLFIQEFINFGSENKKYGDHVLKNLSFIRSPKNLTRYCCSILRRRSREKRNKEIVLFITCESAHIKEK